MKEPIRILHVLQRMEAGGTQALLMNIYRNIDRKKVQFDFLVEYPNKEFYDEEILNMGGKIYYSSVRKDLNIFKFQKQLRKIIKENNYKIIHVHAYTIGYFVLRTAKKCGVPVRVIHSHSNEAVRDYKYLLKLIMQKLYTIHSTDRFACSKEAGIYLYKNKDFRVLNNAIDSNKFLFNANIRLEIRKELELSNNFVVGHVGRFRSEKNHKFLIEIFAEIKKMLPNAKLILVGDGSLKNDIKLQVNKLSLENDVLFLGLRKDVEKIYQCMDVFIFPSIFEGLGIVTVEAQCAGTPVICSDQLPFESKISDIYKQLSLEDNAKKWAEEAIEISKSKNARTNMKKNVVKAKYDIKSIAKEMEEYYLEKYYNN